MAINTDAVQRLYVAYFNRPSDPIGQAYWESKLPATAATQAQLTTIAAGFSGSAEYAALYAGQSNAQIVNNLYLNLFGRAAEPAGLTSWASALTAGTQTFASIALQLTYSAQGTDATAIANKLSAANSFTTSLDTTAEITGYSGTAAAASARTWLATVTDVAATLTAATATATLATAVTAATAAGTSSTGTTFTLTTGVDTLTGTANNDTFLSLSSATGPTLGLADAIDGGAGTDVFKIVTDLAAAIPSIVTTNVETYQIQNSANGTFAVSSSSTAPTAINFVGGGNNTFTLSGFAQTTAVGLEREAGQLTLTVNSVTGTADALSLNLNGAVSTASVAAAGIETFNVASTGAASTLAALTGAQGSKLVVTGDKALTITANLANTFTTVDASAATAAVKIGVATGGNVAVTGGTGDDRFVIVGLDNADTIKGGAGTDTLAVAADVTVSTISTSTQFEKLEFTAATTQDLALVSATGIKTFVSSHVTADAAYTNNENTFFHVASEKTAGTISAVAALNGPADVLNIELSNSDLTAITATNYETINLKSSVGDGTGTVTNVVTTMTNSAAANIVVTGSTNLTITNAIAAQGTVDASAFTGKLVVVGSASADVIKGGSAVDTITAAVGADVITGGGAADIFVIAEGAGTDSAYDTITDFNTGGSDVLRFIAADNVIANASTAAVATANAVIVGGKATFATADDTLAERVVTLIAQTAINEVAFFEQGSDTFVYHSGSVTDGSVDFLVKLTGVIGLTSITESTVTAGDFTLA